jgi:hypothetical protein
MHAAGRPVFLLDDGTRMAEFIEIQSDQMQLVPIDELPIPVFFTHERQTGWLYRLELDE